MSDAVKQILDKLQALADKLGVAVTHIWAFYVRQAHVEAIVYGIAILISVVVCTCLIPGSVQALKEYLTNREKEGSFDGPGGSCNANQAKRLVKFWFELSLSLIFVIVFFSTVKTFLTCLLNPEYAAFQRLFNTIGK